MPTPGVPATPTSRRTIKKGDEVTALQALTQLGEDALDWQKDALFIMLANVKPGQEGRLLGMALSDPDLSDSTPGGRGRNWVLLAASPSAEGVVVFDLDGGKIDLVAGGKVSSALLAQLTGPDISGVEMADLKVSALVDSDGVAKKAGQVGSMPGMGMALVAPARLGLDSLLGEEGDVLPEIVYEVFAPEPKASVIFVDGKTGEPIGESTP